MVNPGRYIYIYIFLYITGEHCNHNHLWLVKIGENLGFCVYRGLCFPWSPVVAMRLFELAIARCLIVLGQATGWAIPPPPPPLVGRGARLRQGGYPPITIPNSASNDTIRWGRSARNKRAQCYRVAAREDRPELQSTRVSARASGHRPLKQTTRTAKKAPQQPKT